MKKTATILSLLFGLCAFAQVPQVINYQGKLSSGNAALTGTVSMEFSIYDTSVVGMRTPLWGPQVFGEVLVTDGVFTVLLGENGMENTLPFDSGIFENPQQRYLELLVDGTRLSPRQRIVSTMFALHAQSANHLNGADGGPEKVVYVDSLGRVGVGTTGPEQDLHIKGPDGNSVNLLLEDDSGSQWNIRNNGPLNIGQFINDNFQSYLTIDETGKTLIGNATLSAKVNIGNVGRSLQINDWVDLSAHGGGAGLFAGNAYLDTGDSNKVKYSQMHHTIGAVGFMVNAPGWNKAGVFANEGPAQADQEFDPNWIMTWAPDGNVGIGTSSPDARLHVKSAGNSWQDHLVLEGLEDDSDWDILVDSGLQGDFKNALRVRYHSGAEVINMLTDGRVGIGTSSPTQRLQIGVSGDGSKAVANSWDSFSDIRYKKNIKPIANPLNIISKLNGYGFTWRKSQQQSVGFIAQEVEKVIPEIVSTDVDGFKSLAYANLTAVLVEAVKEQQQIIEIEQRTVRQQQAQIEEQQQKISNMESRLERLEALFANSHVKDKSEPVSSRKTEE